MSQLESLITNDQSLQYTRSRRIFTRHINREPTHTMSLFSLPWELRQTILRHALREKGTIELQSPVWAGLSVFVRSLFHVSRALREEAIEAFYKTNDFLWIIDVEGGTSRRSDPSTYPYTEEFQEKFEERRKYVGTLPSTLPWLYPKTMLHLRRLQVNIYLPSEARDARELYGALEGFVKAVDRGRRLGSVHVLITAKRRAQYLPLTTEEVKALEVLAKMRIRGIVEVQTRWYFRAVAAGVHAMGLKGRMKA